jgi:hypothetical protein
VLRPERHLLSDVRQGKKSTQDIPPPSYEGHERAREIHGPLSVACLNLAAARTPLRISKLSWVDVTRDYFVLISELERGCAGGRDAEHSAFALERRFLNLEILVHAPK